MFFRPPSYSDPTADLKTYRECDSPAQGWALA